MSMNIKLAVAHVIKTLRKSKKISQRELAQKSELHINTIQLLEVGRIEAKISTLFFIAKGLDVKLHELVHLFVKKIFNV